MHTNTVLYNTTMAISDSPESTGTTATAVMTTTMTTTTTTTIPQVGSDVQRRLSTTVVKEVLDSTSKTSLPESSDNSVVRDDGKSCESATMIGIRVPPNRVGKAN